MPTTKKELTGAALRVAVAKDVLKMLPLIKPTRGCYVIIPYDVFISYWGKQAKPIMGRVAKYCKVCAMGSVLLAWVKRFDQCTVDELGTSGFQEIVDRLAPAFSETCLRSIETAFEQLWGRYANPRRCLRAIMKNIIRNKGDFKLFDEQDNPITRSFSHDQRTARETDRPFGRT